MKIKILALSVVIAFVSCATRIGDFTIVSTKNYDAGQKYRLAGRKSGQDLVFFFVIPFGTPSIKTAADNAIEAGNGVYLTNAVLESLSRPLFMGYRVTGDVYAPITVGETGKSGERVYALIRDQGRIYLQNGNERVAINP